MGKKSTTSVASRVSSAVAPATATGAVTSHKSSILRSSFAPSSLQLRLFASVIQSFESQQLRLHDINTGQLRQQHAANPGITITSLDWGHYGRFHTEDQQSSQKKKRKRVQAAPENAVIAYGTSSSEVCIYSPSEGRLVGSLSGGHAQGIKDFRFSLDGNSAWSIGGDSKLVQWDLSKNQAVRTISLASPSASYLATPSEIEPNILCASNTPLSVTLSSDDVRIDPYDSFKTSVRAIYRSGLHAKNASETFLAADSERYINIFDIEQKKLIRTLVASSEVEQVAFYDAAGTETVLQEQALAIVNRDGAVEIFSQPFYQSTVLNGDLKSRRKNMTRKANAQVKLVHQGSRNSAAIFSVCFYGSDLVLVSIDGGVEPVFQKVRWRDEGNDGMLLEGSREFPRAKSSSTLTAATMNGVKDVGNTQVDESRTVVLNGGGEVGLEQPQVDAPSSSDGDEMDSDNDSEKNKSTNEQEFNDVSDEEMEEAGTLVEGESDDAAESMQLETALDKEPTFGEMLSFKHPTTIAIADALKPKQAALDLGNKQLAAPSGMSLGTVLTQALRTNDPNLLESCLHANDAGVIENTITRLDSGLASILLSKLADRIASRPGRYGHLLSWVQWTCIAHGGVLASQSDVVAKIGTLYKVLSQRSKSFDKLLLLKGKLDLLDAQLAFRKKIQGQQGGPIKDPDEPDMIYIEGQGDNWSSEDDFDEAIGESSKLGFKTRRPLQKDLSDLVGDQESSGEEEEDIPLVNGVGSEISDNDDEEEDSDVEVNGLKSGGLVDIEADVSGEGEDDASDEEEGDDVDDSALDDEEDEDEEDSSMDDFINDGSVGEASDEDDVDIDNDDSLERPKTKRSKHR